MRHLIIISIVSVWFSIASAQSLTIDSAVMLALKNHPSMAAGRSETARQKYLKRSSPEIPKTEITLMRGQFNSIVTDENITVAQTIPFPLTIVRQKKLANEMIASAMISEDITKNELAYQVKQTFNLLIYLETKHKILQQQDTLFKNALRAAEVQYRTGEIPLLTRTLAETQRMEIGNALERNQKDIESTRTTLQLLCRASFTHTEGKLDGLIADEVNSELTTRNPSLRLSEQNVKIAAQERKLESSRTLPELKLAYFNQTLIGMQNINGQDVYFSSSKRFDGFQFGISLPLWFPGHAYRVKASRYAEEASLHAAENKQLQIQNEINAARQELAKNRNSLAYYRQSSLQTAKLLREQTDVAFRNGEIDYQTMLVNLRQVLAIEDGYLTTLYNFNENLITIQYLNGNY